MTASNPPSRPSRDEIQQQVERLQEAGVVDLDAPLRDAMPELARTMARYRQGERAWWVIASGDNPHAVCECDL
ncbi:hypothetical protein ACH4E8_30020 [Streptomyces sp. NPDC017979]|uniref:hypothetical protein n=1 Tax=Streptomyces sp. NPDC017979 TaxID=3365024 RepID=UPI003791386B